MNDETESLAFIVQFSATGFIRSEKVADPQWDEQAAFVYRMAKGIMEYREFAASDMQTRFGVTSLDALLAPEMLKRVFGPQ